ncbi:MAG TPA: universal stress protein [Gemmatimonadales bacterium]|nr:universal stress protein [Gemmatimonadales bacterium]
MYRRILVPLDHSAADQAILQHVRRLAPRLGASVVLLHVSDGWAARNLRQLNLRESDEMRSDRSYLERTCAELAAEGIETDAVLGAGSAAAEIVATAEREGCDLIAMGTHGHRLLGDLLHGSVATEVRHRSMIPVLMVRATTGDMRTDSVSEAARKEE